MNEILPKRKPGARTKFSWTKARQFAHLRADGVPWDKAAAIVGWSPQSAHGYRKRYSKFEQLIQRADALGIKSRLDIVIKAMASADESIRLRSATWWLERRVPEFNRSRLEISGADGKPLAGAIQIFLPQKDVLPAVDAHSPATKEITNGSR